MPIYLHLEVINIFVYFVSKFGNEVTETYITAKPWEMLIVSAYCWTVLPTNPISISTLVNPAQYMACNGKEGRNSDNGTITLLNSSI